MQYGSIPGVAKPVPRIVQGGVRLSTKEQDATDRLLDEVYARGCTAAETARTYSGGTSEQALGSWIRRRGVRDRFVIMTKGGKAPDQSPRLHERGIVDDLDASLEALRTDYIDLYMLHRDDETVEVGGVEVGGVVEILNRELKKGKFKAFAGSNWSHERIRAANEYAAAHGLAGFAGSSPQFSLAEQVEIPWPGCISIGGPGGAAARDWYAATKLPVIFWSSLAGGFFSGRFRRDNLATFTEYWEKVCVDTYCREPNFRRLDRARELAAAKGVSVPQIAIAYTLSQPMNVFCLSSCANGRELEDNLGAFDVQLSAAELDWLDLRRDARP